MDSPKLSPLTQKSTFIDSLAWAVPLLWKGRGFVMRVSAIGIALALLVAFAIPRSYQSTARLMPPDPQAKAQFALMASALGAASPAAAGTGLAGLVNSRSPSAVFLAILQSRTAQDDLINRFDLRKVYWCRRYARARRILQRRTMIDEDKKTGVVSITVSDHSPQRARDLASAYIDELNRLVVLMDSSSAHRERVFLEERLLAVKHDLDSASEELSRFSSQNGTMDVQHQAGVMLEATSRVQGELIAAQSRLRGLQAIYSPENARVREAQATVTNLQLQLEKIGGIHSDGTPDAGTGLPFPSLRQLPVVGLTYTDLYRRVTVQQTVYETLTRQYELAKVEEAKEVPTVNLLDAPDVPERSSFPPRVVIVIAAFLLAFAGACTWLIVIALAAAAPQSYPLVAACLRILKPERDPAAPATLGV